MNIDRPVGEVTLRLGLIGEEFVVGFGSKRKITKHCFVCYNTNAVGVGSTGALARADFEKELHFFNLNDHYSLS